MAEPNQSNLTNPDLWIRLVYMLLFWVLSWLARAAVLVISLIQCVLALVNGETNANLRNLGQGIARWTEQNYLFLTFVSDEKPYPFQDWPVAMADAEDVTEVAEDLSPEDVAAHADDVSAPESKDDGSQGGFGNIREP